MKTVFAATAEHQKIEKIHIMENVKKGQITRRILLCTDILKVNC